MVQRNQHRVAAVVVAAVVASVASLGLISATALADLPAGTTFDLAGAGSGTTTPVMDAIANITTPGNVSGDSTLFDSFEPTGSATVNTTDPFTPSGVESASQPRPNSDSAALAALAGTLPGTAAGCFQFASSSRGPISSDPTVLTWIPFAQDIVDFAVTNTSAIPQTLSLTQLQAYYTCDPSLVGVHGGAGNPGYNGYARNPVLPQAGSGTRVFWESLMGITDDDTGSGTFGSGSLGCIVNGFNPADTSQAWEERTGVFLGDFELEPFSVASYEDEAEGLITDLRGRAVLGDLENPNGTVWQPLIANAPGSQTGVAVPAGLEREIYNVVPTSNVTGSDALSTEIQQLFVGPNSELCSPTAFGGAIQATILEYHLLPDPNCGSTTLTGLVTAGALDSCALLSAGRVDCWGLNVYGELGDGTSTTDSLFPVQVVGVGGSGSLSGVTQVAAGEMHTCALLSAGTVDCWGYNRDAQLGNGTLTNSSTPVAVVGVGGSGVLTSVTQVATGGFHTCAVLTGGTVDCWGFNGEAELGNGATTGYSPTPVPVVGVGGSGVLTGVTQVATGGFHSCALLTGGTVDCWGDNPYGDLGDGTTTNSSTPVPVVGVGGSGVLSGVADISAAGYDTCALLSAGTVDCWGLNGNGQLADGTTTDSLVPVQVVGEGGNGVLTGVIQVATGDTHTCALLSAGTADCWGWDYYGELGNGTTTDSAFPVQVVGEGGNGVLSGVTQISTAGVETCALLAAGRVGCWGYNTFGELGNGTTSNSSTPVEVLGL